MQKQRIKNDKVYIKKLHEYNYLKDSAFTLVGLVADIRGVAAKQVFDDFDVRDVENE